MMDRGEFAALLMELHVDELEINDTKGEEYATFEDALADFRAVAQDVDVPLRKVIYTYMLKHWRAIGSYCRRGEVLSNETLRSRVNDLRLYSALLLAEQLDGEELDSEETEFYAHHALGEIDNQFIPTIGAGNTE